MGLFTTAVAFGAGYTFGRPDGRAQLERYLRRARQFADKPEVRRLRERGWNLAGDRLAAVQRRSAGQSSGAVADPASSGAAAEDARAAMLGQGTLSPPHHPGAPGPTPAGP